MTTGNKTTFRLCDLCLEPIGKNAVSYNVFVVNTNVNRNKYVSNDLVTACRNCYFNNEKIQRSL